MITTFSSPQVGFILALLSLVAAVVPLTPLRFGVYPEIEPVQMILWIVGPLAGWWVTGAWHRYPRLMGRVLQSPAIWTVFPIVILSIVTGFFQPAPLRTWVGQAALLQGAQLIGCIWLLSILYRTLWYVPAARRIMTYVTLATCTTLVILGLIHNNRLRFPGVGWIVGHSFPPYMFDDFISFALIAMIAVYWQARRDVANAWTEGMLLVFTGMTLYYTSNYTLSAGVGLLVLAYGFIRLWPFWSIPQRYVFVYIVGLGAITLILTAVGWMPEVLFNDKIPYIGSFRSRAQMMAMPFVDLVHHSIDWDWIKNLIIGRGWGNISNTFTHNCFLLNTVAYLDNEANLFEFFTRDLLHTHNLLTDTFHALGLLGLSACVWAWFHQARNVLNTVGFILFLALGIQYALWFETVSTTPYTALALVVLLNTRGQSPRWLQRVLMPGIRLLAPLYLAFGLIHTAALYQYAHMNCMDKKSCIAMSLDADWSTRWHVLTGGERIIKRTASRIGDFLYDYEVKKDTAAAIYKAPDQTQKRKPMAEADALWLIQQLGRLGDLFPPHVSLASSSYPMNMIGTITHRAELKDLVAHPDVLKIWDKYARRLVTEWPYRPDFLIPYLTSQLTRGQTAVVRELSSQVLAVYPDSAVMLWFSGLVDLGTSPSAILKMKQALDLKVDRVIMVEPAVKKQILARAIAGSL